MVLIQQISPGLHVEDYRSRHVGTIPAAPRHLQQAHQPQVLGPAPILVHPGAHADAPVFLGGPSAPVHGGAFCTTMPPGPGPMMAPCGSHQALFPPQPPSTASSSSQLFAPPGMSAPGIRSMGVPEPLHPPGMSAPGIRSVGVPEPLHPPSWKSIPVPEQVPFAGGCTSKACTGRPGPTQCPAPSAPSSPLVAAHGLGVDHLGHMPIPSKSPTLRPEATNAQPAPWFQHVTYVYLT